MPEPNPYQSPTAEPRTRPVPWLKVTRAVVFNVLLCVLMFLFWNALFVLRNIWLTGVVAGVFVLMNATKLRPEEARWAKFQAVEYLFFGPGLLVALLLTYVVNPANPMHFTMFTQLCWICGYFTVRDSLYAAGVFRDPRDK